MSVDPNSIAADLAALKAHLIAKEQAEAKKITTWLKANWLHIANAGGVAVAVAKLFGKL